MSQACMGILSACQWHNAHDGQEWPQRGVYTSQKDVKRRVQALYGLIGQKQRRGERIKGWHHGTGDFLGSLLITHTL